MNTQSSSTQLDQEAIDLTTRHLMNTEITDAAVGRALKYLDDLEPGAGQLPPDWKPYCHKCNEQMQDNEMVGIAYGNFYHDRCVPSLSEGPMPLGQLLVNADELKKHR